MRGERKETVKPSSKELDQLNLLEKRSAESAAGVKIEGATNSVLNPRCLGGPEIFPAHPDTVRTYSEHSEGLMHVY